jgi:hypothetical protein
VPSIPSVTRLVQDGTRQTPGPLAPVDLLLERKSEFDSDDALGAVKPEWQAINSGDGDGYAAVWSPTSMYALGW